MRKGPLGLQPIQQPNHTVGNVAFNVDVSTYWSSVYCPLQGKRECRSAGRFGVDQIFRLISTIERVTNKPNPIPLRLVVTNGSNKWSATA